MNLGMTKISHGSLGVNNPVCARPPEDQVYCRGTVPAFLGKPITKLLGGHGFKFGKAVQVHIGLGNMRPKVFG